MTAVARSAFVTVLVALSLSLTGCADGVPDGPLAADVEAALRPHEAAGEAVINFDELVSGDWTQLVVVCGANSDAVNEALGFEWDRTKRDSTRSRAVFIFSTDDEVEQFFEPVTWAAFDDREYISSCFAGIDYQVPVVYPRGSSEISFTLTRYLDQLQWQPKSPAERAN